MKARELVDQAPERKLSIADLAHAAGIAEAHFSRCFRESFGLPPYQYILERRLAKARDLLSRTDLTVTEIASICGFESLSTFINIFTREHRQSPSSFRSRKLAGSDKRRTARSGNVEETTEQLNGTET
ncbi:MAG: helix-turn-helix transcriptional regulator [Bdellovibrionales bacterium]|nr:helix-turn-helix transcriptional regulator [Bdellovibrionales bacterium]